MRNPAVRQLSLGNALLLRNLIPLLQPLAQRRLVVHARVHAAERFLVEAANAGVEVGGRLGQEAACERRVGVEYYAELAQDGEQLLLRVARDGVVVALVDFGERVAFGLGVVVDALDVGGGVVAEAETLEDALLVHLVDAGEGVFERNVWVGGVDVEDVELLDVDLLESLLCVLDNGVLARCVWSEAAGHLGVDCELGALLLFAERDFGAGVYTRGVDGGYA